MKNRRKVRNLLLNPRFQGKYVLLVGGAALLVSIVYAGIFYSYIKENYAILVELSPMTDAAKAQLYSELRQIVLLLGAGSLVFVSVVSWLALFFTHRSAGPLYQFKKVFEDIRSGKVDARIHLRPWDDFQEVADSFNEMMESLDKKDSSGPDSRKDLKQVS